MSNPTGKGGAKKGEVRNPWGRPRSPAVVQLEEALTAVGKERKKTAWRHVAEQFFVDNNVMRAVINKFVPDSLKMEVDGFSDILKKLSERYKSE